MTKSYILVNPYIEGNMTKIFNAENSLVAADKAYQQLSGYFNNSVKKFHFTLLKLKSDSFNEESFNLKEYAKSNQKYLNTKYFSNFEASEQLSNDKVKYMISSLSGEINQNAVDNLVSNINKIQKKLKKSKKSKKKSKKSSSRSSSESPSVSSKSSQDGGKRSKYDDDDDDDDDDSPDNFVKVINPISYYYYYPYFYDTYVYNPDPYFYVPTFVSPLSFPLVIDFKPTTLTASSASIPGNTTVRITP